jgi:hypothetical protein
MSKWACFFFMLPLPSAASVFFLRRAGVRPLHPKRGHVCALTERSACLVCFSPLASLAANSYTCTAVPCNTPAGGRSLFSRKKLRKKAKLLFFTYSLAFVRVQGVLPPAEVEGRTGVSRTAIVRLPASSAFAITVSYTASADCPRSSR